MRLELSVTKSESRDITPPKFWKNQNAIDREYLGLVNEDLVVKIYSTQRITSITHSKISARISDISVAILDQWEEVTANEFFNIHDNAIALLSIKNTEL